MSTTRSRSNSFQKLLSSNNNNSFMPSAAPQPQQNTCSKRSMSLSEGINPPVLFQSETDMLPSESNWANQIQDFDIGNPIGYGSSATVYEAIYRPLNIRVAIKIIDLDMFERNQIEGLRRETALMALSKHPNILRVYGSFVDGNKLHIVTPYLSAGSCLDIIKTGFPNGFDEVSIATILRQALEGLIYLHKNNHIHRDIKAGNLLMDEHGSVLLADFGVSSSLSDNSEVKKTFVGTPCWMAPEVMEQAGYNLKADIWSFGITSLELATGHAPFAKYPPMKVLLMTLSKPSPTLDRENSKHKYSKTFKEMIDTCLQKDPTKRPTAEKLLSHPFFKQAKKKDHLIKSVLQHVPALDQRSRSKVPLQKFAVVSIEQWDFDEASNHQKQSTENIEQVIKTTVQIEASPKSIHVNSHSRTASFENTVKKHISFGEAVIKDPSINKTIATPIADEATPVLKKSRFVIEDNTHPLQDFSPSLISQADDNTFLGITENALTISASASINSSSSSNNNTFSNVTSPLALEGEIKIGRFSINQNPARTTTCLDDNTVDKQQQQQQFDLKAAPIQRMSSQDSLQERKSRFEIKHNNASSSTVSSGNIESHTPINTLPLTRENSNTPGLSRDCSVNKASRFSIEKSESLESCSLLSPECRKVGRFELTGGSNTPIEFGKQEKDLGGHFLDLTPPLSTLIGQSPLLSPSGSILKTQQLSESPNMMLHHLEYLMKQNEIQKNMLQDLSVSMSFSANQQQTTSNTPLYNRNRALSDAKKSSAFHIDEFHQRAPTSNPTHLINNSNISHDITSTFEHLQQLLIASDREKERLYLENESLKKEIEKLKKQNVQ